jgi:hypothetical protein
MPAQGRTGTGIAIKHVWNRRGSLASGEKELRCMSLSRRQLLISGSVGLAAAMARPVFAASDSVVSAAAQAIPTPAGVSPELFKRALAALERHKARIPNRDLIALADFTLPSRTPRFHVVELATGQVRSHLVAHGRDSDPRHTGWLERFSNEMHSNATSSGAYCTNEFYVGGHGRAISLIGLDPTNDNAEPRGIVVHRAWYVSEEMARRGVLGRSEGCFALSDSSMNEVLGELGPGHMIYADKVPGGTI